MRDLLRDEGVVRRREAAFDHAPDAHADRVRDVHACGLDPLWQRRPVARSREPDRSVLRVVKEVLAIQRDAVGRSQVAQALRFVRARRDLRHRDVEGRGSDEGQGAHAFDLARVVGPPLDHAKTPAARGHEAGADLDEAHVRLRVRLAGVGSHRDLGASAERSY